MPGDLGHVQAQNQPGGVQIIEHDFAARKPPLLAFGAIGAIIILATALLLGKEREAVLTTARIGVLGISLVCYLLVTRIRPQIVEPLIVCWQAIVTLSAAIFASTASDAALVAVFLLPALFYLAVPVTFRTAVATGVSSSALMLVAYGSAEFYDNNMGIAVALVVMNSALLAGYRPLGAIAPC